MSTEFPEPVEVTINGERRRIKVGQSILQLLETLEIPPTRVAIELDRNILKKALWEGTRLRGGEELEIVHFVGGG